MMKTTYAWSMEEPHSHYWYITNDGSVDWDTWEGRPANMADSLIGNVFWSAEEAMIAYNALRVLAELRRFSFHPDWSNATQEKWCLTWQQGIVKPVRVYIPTGLPVFPSEDRAEACIRFITCERLQKFWFRLEDTGCEDSESRGAKNR